MFLRLQYRTENTTLSSDSNAIKSLIAGRHLFLKFRVRQSVGKSEDLSVGHEFVKAKPKAHHMPNLSQNENPAASMQLPN